MEGGGGGAGGGKGGVGGTQRQVESCQCVGWSAGRQGEGGSDGILSCGGDGNSEGGDRIQCITRTLWPSFHLNMSDT